MTSNFENRVSVNGRVMRKRFGGCSYRERRGLVTARSHYGECVGVKTAKCGLRSVSIIECKPKVLSAKSAKEVSR